MSTIKTVGGWKDFFSNPWKALSMKQGMGILHIIFATAITVFLATLLFDREDVIPNNNTIVESIVAYIIFAIAFTLFDNIVIGRGIEYVQVKWLGQEYINETDIASTTLASPISYVIFFFVVSTEKEKTVLITTAIISLLCVAYWVAKKKGNIK